MELFYIAYYLSYAQLYGLWAILIAALVVGLVMLTASRSRRVIGGVLVAVSSLCIGFLVLTPERLAWQSHKEALKASVKPPAPPETVPRTLVVHRVFDLKDRGGLLDDAKTLAETGLFDVLLAKEMFPGTKIIGRVDIIEASDCLERRLDAELKIGALTYTARTGFSQCASVTPIDMDLPADRLNLWTYNPPGMPPADPPNRGNLRGTMLLSLTENGITRDLATREKRDRMIGFRDGTYFYEGRDPHSQITSWREYDPDPVEFVLSTLGKDEAELPQRDRIEPSELVRRGEALLKRAEAHSVSVAGPKAAITYRAALALVGAPQRGIPEAEQLMALAAPHFSAGFVLPARVPSDCRVADAVFKHRQLIGDLCIAEKQRWPNNRVCNAPIETEGYKERCLREYRSTVWADNDIKGRRVLLVDGERGDGIPFAIGKSSYPTTLHQIEIVAGEGLLDIVVSSDTTFWSFSGATECIARITVLGKDAGIIGIGRDRVRFKYRADVQRASQHSDPMESKALRDMLAHPPEIIFRGRTNITKIGSEVNLSSTGFACAADRVKDGQELGDSARDRYSSELSSVPLSQQIRLQDIVVDPTDIVREVPQR